MDTPRTCSWTRRTRTTAATSSTRSSTCMALSSAARACDFLTALPVLQKIIHHHHPPRRLRLQQTLVSPAGPIVSNRRPSSRHARDWHHHHHQRRNPRPFSSQAYEHDYDDYDYTFGIDSIQTKKKALQYLKMVGKSKGIGKNRKLKSLKSLLRQELHKKGMSFGDLNSDYHLDDMIFPNEYARHDQSFCASSYDNDYPHESEVYHDPDDEVLLSSAPFDKHTVSMLKDGLRQRGLKVGGRKAELLERLRSHDAAAAVAAAAAAAVAAVAAGGENEDDSEEEDNERTSEIEQQQQVIANIDVTTVMTPTMCVFDKANGMQLTPHNMLVQEGRYKDMLLSPALNIPDEVDTLLDLLPPHYFDVAALQHNGQNGAQSSSSSSPLLLRRRQCDGKEMKTEVEEGEEDQQQQVERGEGDQEKMTKHAKEDLVEIVLDVGRRPTCWLANGKREFLFQTKNNRIAAATPASPASSTAAESVAITGNEKFDNNNDDDAIDDDYIVTKDDLDHVIRDLSFGEDNRAGIERCLHRISGIRNRDGNLVGATLRVGRYVPGNAVLIADLLHRSNSSILFVGPPGSAKTSILRDAARILSQKQSVVIVDTSCEIGGAGDVPHDCIGRSRRMQVKNIQSQAQVMVECVQNHTPSVIVIDEIGRAAEVQAALTCKERGVRIMASAHGSLPGLVRNTELCELVGGVDIVTIGDKSAQKQAQRGGSGSKLKAQRKGPPVFDAIVELKRGHLHEWKVVLQTKAAVDDILAQGKYSAQMRRRHPEGKEAGIEIQNIVSMADLEYI